MPRICPRSIHGALFGTFIFVLVAMTALLVCGWQADREMRDTLRRIHAEQLAFTQRVTAANNAIRGACRPMLEWSLDGQTADTAPYEQRLEETQAVARAQLEALQACGGLTADDRKLLEQIRADLATNAAQAVAVLRLAARGRQAEAARLCREDVRGVKARLEQQVGRLQESRQAELDRGVALVEQQHARAAGRRNVWAAAATVCIGAVLLLLARHVSQGVDAAVRAADAIARDVLSKEMPRAPRSDEMVYVRHTLEALRTAVETSLAERAAVQDRLHTLEADLAHAARVNTVGELACGLVHQLAQPLAAIGGYTEACLELLRADTATPGRLRGALEHSVQQTHRAGAILGTLRGFARRQPEPETLLELDGLVRDSLKLVEHELRRRRARLALMPEAGSVCVRGRRLELEQVLVNLLRNALEAMAGVAEPELSVRTRRAAEGHVAVDILDRGVGLSADVRANLFKPFFTTKAQGLGMGLAISRRLIEAHGGRVGAEDNPGGGSIFTVRLPTCGEADAALQVSDGAHR